ncbi:MAG TPA: tellurite resistance TerB family protein [Bauldia sp.]|nr:tellurite resistance TerB family protein [Bauldia sp.]
MFDPKQLLDQFLGGQPGDGAWSDRSSHAAWDNPPPGGGMMDRVGAYTRQNPMLAGGIAGGLAGLLLGRGFGGDLLKYGGMALIGGLAYKAWRDYQESNLRSGTSVGHDRPAGFAPPPADSPFAPANAPQGPSKLAETLIVAMIAAAKADGHIDAEERGRIYQRLEEGGLQPEEVAFLQRELTEPVDVERIVAGATSKEAAIEIYAASLMAVRSDTPQEREYLATLANRLNLEPGLVSSIEKTVDAVVVK